MGILRHHDDEPFDPQTASPLAVDVCMHAGFGPVRTAKAPLHGRLFGRKRAAHFRHRDIRPVHGHFQTMWLDASSGFLSALRPEPASTYDSSSLFWSHERVHRATLLNYPERIKTYAGDRDMLEKKFVQGALNYPKRPLLNAPNSSVQCFREAAQAEKEWLKRIEQVPARRKMLYASAWNGFNQES